MIQCGKDYGDASFHVLRALISSFYGGESLKKMANYVNILMRKRIELPPVIRCDLKILLFVVGGNLFKRKI
jgi:hypothetical protein